MSSFMGVYVIEGSIINAETGTCPSSRPGPLRIARRIIVPLGEIRHSFPGPKSKYILTFGMVFLRFPL